MVTLLPMLAGYLFATKILKIEFLTSTGAICGGMTSTPGLATIASASDSDTPAIAYATIYPVALILVTVFAQLLAKLFSALF